MARQTDATYDQIIRRVNAYVNDRVPPLELPSAVRDMRYASLTGSLTALVRMAAIYLTEEKSQQFLADLDAMESAFPKAD